MSPPADQGGRGGLQRLQRFLADELQPYPGRMNLLLRNLLGSALVIVISMTLQVPLLALSLIVVFYVTQTNVVLTRMVGVLFLAGATLAIGLTLLLLKFTYGYPLLRIVGAAALFFCCAWLIRVTRIGVVFFVVGIVVIYAQTFVDLTDQAEAVTRLVLWVWVAVSYAIALTLAVNTLLLPAEPARQLERHLSAQLRTVSRCLGGEQSGASLGAADIQRSVLAAQQLLRFTCMREPGYRERQAAHLARISGISRLLTLASQLPPPLPNALAPALLRQAVLDLRASLESGLEPEGLSALDGLDTSGLPGVYEEMRLTLLSLRHGDDAVGPAPGKAPLLVPDAFENPVYVQFALKTLLAALVCYVFYMATDWQGIHTIMLTCLIVAQPSLGATGMRAALRVGGALAGSALALAMVVWWVPHIDGIVGLLFMALPVIALGAWIAAGSERISYAGVQIVFTFALALLEQFGPSTNLTEIRDRLIGVLLGVVVSLAIHAWLWPEAEGEVLRQRVAKLVTRLAQALKTPRPADGVSTDLRVWSEFADCRAMLARVALEPGWEVGESHQEVLVFRMQALLARLQAVAMAVDAWEVEMTHARAQGAAGQAAQALGGRTAQVLDDYAQQLNHRRGWAVQRAELERLREDAQTQLGEDGCMARFLALIAGIESLPASAPGRGLGQ